MLRMRLAGSGPFVDRLQAHLCHQSPDAMTPDNNPFPAQIGRDLAADPKNGYLVKTRSISFIIARVSASIPTGV